MLARKSVSCVAEDGSLLRFDGDERVGGRFVALGGAVSLMLSRRAGAYIESSWVPPWEQVKLRKKIMKAMQLPGPYRGYACSHWSHAYSVVSSMLRSQTRKGVRLRRAHEDEVRRTPSLFQIILPAPILGSSPCVTIPVGMTSQAKPSVPPRHRVF